MSQPPALGKPLAYFSMPAVCLGLGLAMAASAVFAQQEVRVSQRDGLVSVKASKVQATRLAQALSNELGIIVVVAGDTDTLLTADIVDEPLDKAVAKISPNHMLVRATKAADSKIVEVVLMMGEGSDSPGSGSADQFLPTGGPAEEIVDIGSGEDITQPTDGALRDPGRDQMARNAAEAAASNQELEGEASLNDADLPAEMVIDPATGMPVEQQQQ